MKRTQATDITPKVRAEVLRRDNHRCIYCGTPYSLQLAHIFVNRSHGGLGVKENLATLCIACHMTLDNGREVKAKPIRDSVQFYLNHLYDIDIEALKYKKET